MHRRVGLEVWGRHARQRGAGVGRELRLAYLQGCRQGAPPGRADTGAQEH